MEEDFDRGADFEDFVDPAYGHGSRVWKTKSGELIPIKKMGNSHLINTINMLNRFAAFKAEAEIYDAYGELDRDHGEGALMAIEDGIREYEKDFFMRPEEYCPVYKNLEKEAKKRKLNLSSIEKHRELGKTAFLLTLVKSKNKRKSRCKKCNNTGFVIRGLGSLWYEPGDGDVEECRNCSN